MQWRNVQLNSNFRPDRIHVSGIACIYKKIEKDKVSIESVDKKITSKKMSILLQNLDYREMIPIDLQDYFIIECEDKEGVEEWLEDVLEDVEIYQNRSELRKEIREILDEEDEETLDEDNKEGFMSKIFSMFKKKN